MAHTTAQVFVVDDDSASRFAMSVHVAAHPGMTLLGATSVSLATRCALSTAPDAVVLDVATGGSAGPESSHVDGLQTLMELRERWPRSMIFVYTFETESAEFALALGADVVIGKATHTSTVARMLPLAVEQGIGAVSPPGEVQASQGLPAPKRGITEGR